MCQMAHGKPECCGIISVGSRKSGLQSEAKRIFEICGHHGISIEPEWVPRSSNEQADYLSRIVDFDDWSVSSHIFRFLDLKWGPHSIDRFADKHNHLLPRFDSRFWNPYCEAMDTFTRSWDFDNNWVLSATSPCSADSEAHAVLLRSRYFDRSALAFCSILAFNYNRRFSSGSFC